MPDTSRALPDTSRALNDGKNKYAQKNKHAQRLVHWHRIALGLLTAAALAGQIVLMTAMHVPQADDFNALQVERQQTFAQHLVLSALAVQAAQTPARRTAWATDLRDTATLWKQSASALPRTEADPACAAMLDAAQGLLAALPPDSSPQKTDLSPYLTTLFQNQKSYDAGMDTAGAEYAQKAAAHLAALRWLGGGFCAMLVLTLAALSGPAVRPGLGAVGRTLAALDDMEAKTQELDTALGEADRQVAGMRETLENLSTVDALTGLKNHRAFQDQLDNEMGRALRHGHPLSLLLLDIDRFKAYNDSYSHTEGDEALRIVSDLLKETARTTDIPARYGGEEFAVILTDTDMMGAVVLGERLRQAVASADGLQRPLTASIGIATMTPNIFSVPALIAQADRALCHAKGDGRNRVSHAHRIPAPLEDEAPVYARAA